MQSPDILRDNQSEFSKTGGIHASGLFLDNGKLVEIREDVGRHNALDKLVGRILKKKNLNPKKQFIACSGRLNFELVQKVLMSKKMNGLQKPLHFCHEKKTILVLQMEKHGNCFLINWVD